jgi:glycosyltransferase involved in cell wall biosynthesis
MKITFYSNYLNHHQLPLAEEFIKLGIDYTFVATTPIEEERIKLGYEDMNKKYPFVLRAYESPQSEQKALKLCVESDVIILGSAPKIYLKERLKHNKITFRYSERCLKQGLWRLLDPILLLNMYKNNYKFRNKPFYLLAASAYAPWDFKVCGSFINKCYKWGYFPQKIDYDINKLINQKRKNQKLSLLWCGRLINLKHPEKAIYIAEKLKKDGFEFEMILIGTGPLKELLENLIKRKCLKDYVKLVGAVPSSKVRKYMEDANIYLFTSDYNEGWGAVLNESMNSACAVVASHAIGSVPFLIKHNINGLIYKNNDINSLYESVKKLVLDQKQREEISINAYNTISETWNNSKAAKNFLALVKILENKEKNNFINEPCAIANSIKQNKMYRLIVNDE